MIIGLGLDLVDIDRFKGWENYQTLTLQKIFSLEEIAYCRALLIKSPERFAARFAAKEALYKALSPHVLLGKPLPFLTLCQHSSVISTPTGPQFMVNWPALASYLPKLSPPNLMLSLTHNKTTASAVLVLQANAINKQE
jgi:holo-[acyl-carrier protein] synthase